MAKKNKFFETHKLENKVKLHIAAAPKWWTVILIAAAGVGLAFSLYHALRVRAALRLRTSPVAADVIAAHLEITRRFGGTWSSASA